MQHYLTYPLIPLKHYLMYLIYTYCTILPYIYSVFSMYNLHYYFMGADVLPPLKSIVPPAGLRVPYTLQKPIILPNKIHWFENLY